MIDKVFAMWDIVNMSTVTVSARVDEGDARLIEELAQDEGCDRSTLIKSLLRRGLSNLRLESAVRSYARGEITLSRAAEKAGLSIWDFISLMPDHNLTLNYDLGEFEDDLRAVDLNPASK